MQEQLEKYKVTIDDIFTIKNLPAILTVMQSLKPPYGDRCKETEFDTIVYCARIDGMDYLINQMKDYVSRKQ